MRTPPRHAKVMGEKVDDLLPGLLAFHDNAVDNEDGTWGADFTLPYAEMAPLCRALMRVEAHLLREDANRLSSDMQPYRTPDQRRADAFVELVKMLPGAMARARRTTHSASRRTP